MTWDEPIEIRGSNGLLTVTPSQRYGDYHTVVCAKVGGFTGNGTIYMDEYMLKRFARDFATFYQSLKGEASFCGWDPSKLHFKSDALGHIGVDFTLETQRMDLSGTLDTEVGHLTEFARAFRPEPN